jgi:hypothetical protein
MDRAQVVTDTAPFAVPAEHGPQSQASDDQILRVREPDGFRLFSPNEHIGIADVRDCTTTYSTIAAETMRQMARAVR